jgi:hypothetical protein
MGLPQWEDLGHGVQGKVMPTIILHFKKKAH